MVKNALLICCILLISCADLSLDNTASSSSISQGVYGNVQSETDIGQGNTDVSEGFGVKVFNQTPDSSSSELIATESDQNGFYEIPLQVGSYCLCTDFLRCTKIEITQGLKLQMDYTFGLGPGWHIGEPGCQLPE